MNYFHRKLLPSANMLGRLMRQTLLEAPAKNNGPFWLPCELKCVQRSKSKSSKDSSWSLCGPHSSTLLIPSLPSRLLLLDLFCINDCHEMSLEGRTDPATISKDFALELFNTCFFFPRLLGGVYCLIKPVPHIQ